MKADEQMDTSAGVGLLRDRQGPQRVTFVELFFDLVYVFAVTQLSHGLLERLNWEGAFETLILLCAVWAAWNYTAWITNWFDPTRLPVLLMIVGLMFASLVMSVALPEAFGSRGMVFALAYVTIQIGRTLFCIWATRGHELQRNFVRVGSWFAVAAIPWIGGAFADGAWRAALWTLALGIEIVGGFVGFYVPGLGRTRTAEWTISVDHLVERCQLFVIIALGESIVVTGATFSDAEFSAGRIAAFVVAFLGSVAMWWIHFLNSIRMSAMPPKNRDAGGFGRIISYTVVVVIAAIVVSAVGDELVIAHPSGHTEAAWLLVIFGGPALFVAGQALIQLAAFGTVPGSSIVGLVAFAILAPTMASAPPLAAAIAATAVLLGSAAFDTVREWKVLGNRDLLSSEAAEGAGSSAS